MGQKIQGEAKDLGDNFRIHRVLPRRHRRMVGPFIFWDHMGPTEIFPETPMVVRAHPHIGLSTITYLFEGEILHRDSLGNELPIRPGEVNWMTAGAGIAHSERSFVEQGSRALEGIQVWVALPKDADKVPPSFVHLKEKDLPMVQAAGLPLRLIAGEVFGQASPLPVFSALFYLAGEATQDARVSLPLGARQEGAVYVVDGQVQVGQDTLQKFEMFVFEVGETVEFTVQAGSRIMVFGGDVFEEQPQIWWNFVSFNADTMQAAQLAWKQDQFAKVINETERIPLPEK